MTHQPLNLVVIGASAGGISSLLQIASDLPETLSAAILVVVHIGQAPSRLPTVLSRVARLPVSHAVDREQICAGHIYVAPPDYHLIVRDSHLNLSHGPREHHTRPAIDPLFISAARSFGPRVIGVVLSGALSDGAAGLLAIKSRGGRAIVQDPDEALSVGMPRNALNMVDVDKVLRASDIAEALCGMIESNPEIPIPGDAVMADREDATAERIQEDFHEQENDARAGELTPFTCPDCGGTLWQTVENGILGFRCHVGHAWSAETLAGNKSEQLETALWASVRLLVERASLNRQIAMRARDEGSERQGERFAEQANRDQEYASLIRGLLESFSNYSLPDRESKLAE